MQAMDAELARQKRESKSTPQNAETHNKGKGKATETPQGESRDIEAAMDAELKALLEGDDEDDYGGVVDDPVDYNLIKNFLESFKSQQGLSGPVSNLAGRLQPGWKLPRDSA
jgi:hypothetical protein